MNAPRKPVETKPVGLEPLAVLPVFLKLDGRRAVLAGGNAGAAWKAKLLAATGAAVDVFAPEPSEEMRSTPEQAVSGTITLHQRSWRAEDLDGAAFAVAASEDEEDCVRFVSAARACGAIVNAVDRPQLCDVQFGAIVNRSPLVVGISTEGAAPVFAQAIRSRIEALLPRGFAAWVGAAKGWRDEVALRLASSRARRDFWESFSDRALAEHRRAPRMKDLREIIGAVVGRERTTGSVALVGAGPGDPELLTLKALRALRTADVILYDDLVAREILDYARREARTMLVGKTGHGPSCKQDEINALMLKLAREGRRVVRLKGGDPLIFGRAGEELDACRDAGIPVELIPGITAAQGAAASLSISLTDRRVATRVQFVTGHDKQGALPKLNWSAIADPKATTVVYMPKRTIRVLVDRAIQEGLSTNTPAVAILNATRADERVLRAEIGALPYHLDQCDSTAPAIVLIGEALRERRTLEHAPKIVANR